MKELVTQSVPDFRANRPLLRLPRPLRYALTGANIFISLGLLASCAPATGNREQSSGGNSNNPAIAKTLDDLDLALALKGPGRFTGGPHDSNRRSGVRNSIDEAPKIKADCPHGVKKFLDDPLVVASASGTVTAIGNERDPNDKMHSIIQISTPIGIRVETMHLGQFQVSVGDKVKAGETVVGKLACEAPPGGDISEGMHAHTSLWGKDGTPISIKDHTFSDWTVHESSTEYNGTLTKPGEETRTADVGTCGPDEASIKACGGIRNDISYNEQALTANPKEGATPLPTIPEITPTFVPLIPKPAPTPKPFKIGDSVVVVANPLSGCLEQRVAPSTSANVVIVNDHVMCFPDGARLNIQGGPVYKDGYNWWETTKWANGEGWSADAYLNLVPPESTPPPGWARHKSTEIGYSLDYLPNWSVTQENNPHGGFQNKFQENIKAVYPPQIIVGNELTNGKTLDEIAQLTEGGFLQSNQPQVNTVILEKGKTKIAGRDAFQIKARMTIMLLPRGLNRPDLDTNLDMTYTAFIDNGKDWAFFMLNETSQTNRLLPVYDHMINSFGR